VPAPQPGLVINLAKLKKVSIWFNESEFEELRREAEKRGLTPYAYTKQLILKRKLNGLLIGYLLVFSALANLFYLYVLNLIISAIA